MGPSISAQVCDQRRLRPRPRPPGSPAPGPPCSAGPCTIARASFIVMAFTSPPPSARQPWHRRLSSRQVRAQHPQTPVHVRLHGVDGPAEGLRQLRVGQPADMAQRDGTWPYRGGRASSRARQAAGRLSPSARIPSGPGLPVRGQRPRRSSRSVSAVRPRRARLRPRLATMAASQPRACSSRRRSGSYPSSAR